MDSDLSLNRRKPTGPLISLVPMIDVMLILLVFFMVTSTYLNLDMIPALAQSNQPAQASSGQAGSETLLVRIGADGAPYHRGRAMTLDALADEMTARLTANPALRVIILPTGGAKLQALVSVMDTVTGAGAVNMRVVRLEARP
nr:biopolymer transporter ExbD [Ruegeria lacuscaerulensis]